MLSGVTEITGGNDLTGDACWRNAPKGLGETDRERDGDWDSGIGEASGISSSILADVVIITGAFIGWNDIFFRINQSGLFL